MSARSTSTGTGVVLDSTVSMATLQHRILVPAAPPRVFELLTDPTSFPRLEGRRARGA